MTGQVKRMGLVLSGGGAKGAYQAGVFQAMEEAGLCPRVEAISGCSIGAMNALLFATGDPALWRQAWEESDFGAMGGGVTPARMEALALQATQAGGLERYLQGEWLLPLDPLRQLARQVAEAVQKAGAERLAVGLPRNMDGTEGESAAFAREMGARLRSLTGLETVFVDERGTTVTAHGYLNETNTRGKKRKAVVDAVAAVVILEDYLRWRRNHPGE